MDKKTLETHELLTVVQAAEFLNVSAGTIRRWANDSYLKGSKIGLRGEWRFTKEELASLSKPNSSVVENTPVVSPIQHEHIVQFYEDEEYLLNSVRTFIEEGEAAIVIAKPEHLKIIEKNLLIQGIALEVAIKKGLYVSLDAEETLELCMVDGKPNKKRFFNVIGTVLENVGRHGKKIRVFGEMVATLYERDNSQGAIELEELWNELQSKHTFALFCAYPVHLFSSSAQAEDFKSVCGTHSVVIPVESYERVPSQKERSREIANLQQKAASLEESLNKVLLMELELRQQKDELDDFFENSAIGIHFVGPDGIIICANKTELNMLGYSSEEYIGHDIREFHVHGEGIASILATLSKGEILVNHSAKLRCKDGSIKDVLINSNVLWRDGKFIHTRCFTRDVSERNKQRALLLKNESRFRALVTATSEVVYRMSPDCTEMRQLNGHSFSEDTGEPIKNWLSKYIHPDDQKEVWDVIQESILTKSNFQLEHRVLQLNGEYRWTLSRAVPIQDSDGEIIEWFGAASDISGRKLHETLLKEEDKRKDEFLAILAHELRNPLSPISSSAQILKLNDHLSDEDSWAVDVINRQLYHMTRLIDDLLDISRIASNKLEMQKEKIAIHDVIVSAVEASRPAIHEGNHTFVHSALPKSLYVEGDLVRLSQAVSNLLTNAAKYTPMGGIIELCILEEKDSVVLKIKDSGIGIPPDMTKKIFEMFVQGQRYTLARKGMGIGLSLVKRIIEMHGGDVTAESKGPNKGSTFTITLPKLKTEEDASVTESKISAPEIALQRILIVDDNYDALISLQLLLKKQGNKTAIANDGLEAIQMVQDFVPDVVLLDIGMPNMDGYQTAKVIRSQPWGKNMKLIALTGWGQESDKKRTFEAGFDYHLTKPVNSAELTQILSSFDSSTSS